MKFTSFDKYYDSLLDNRDNLKSVYTRAVKQKKQIFEAESFDYAMVVGLGNSLSNAISVPSDEYKANVKKKSFAIIGKVIKDTSRADLESIEILTPYIDNIKNTAMVEAQKLYPDFEDCTPADLKSIMNDCWDLEGVEGADFNIAIQPYLDGDKRLFKIHDQESVVASVKNNILAYALPALSELESVVKDIMAMKADNYYYDMESVEVRELTKALNFEFGSKAELEDLTIEATNAAHADIESFNEMVYNIASMATDAVSEAHTLGVSDIAIADLESHLQPLLVEAESVKAKFPDLLHTGYNKLKKVLNTSFEGSLGTSDELLEMESLIINCVDRNKVAELESSLVKVNEMYNDMDTPDGALNAVEIKKLNGAIFHGGNIISSAKYIENESVQLQLSEFADHVDELNRTRRRFLTDIKGNLVKEAISVGHSIVDMESMDKAFDKIDPAKTARMISAKVNDLVSVTTARLVKITKASPVIAKRRLNSMKDRVINIQNIISTASRKIKDAKLVKGWNTSTNNLINRINIENIKLDKKISQNIKDIDPSLPVLECVEVAIAREAMIDYNRIVENTTMGYDAEDINDEESQHNIIIAAGVKTSALLYLNGLGLTRETNL